MFDDDQMTESPELRALRGSLDGVPMPARPPLEAITPRGRSHRRTRHSGIASLFVAGAAAGAALTVALIGGGNPGQGMLATVTQGSHHAPQAIRTAGYTLISDTSGKVKLTINPMRLFHPAALQSDLARFGIPAKVTDGRLCQSHPEPAGLSRVVTINYHARPQTITFDPKGIPRGTELSIGRFFLKMHVQLVDTVLIRTGTFTCTTHVPTDRPAGKPGQAIGFIAIPAGRATSHG
jgi:hypothetical protein